MLLSYMMKSERSRRCRPARRRTTTENHFFTRIFRGIPSIPLRRLTAEKINTPAPTFSPLTSYKVTGLSRMRFDYPNQRIFHPPGSSLSAVNRLQKLVPSVDATDAQQRDWLKYAGHLPPKSWLVMPTTAPLVFPPVHIQPRTQSQLCDTSVDLISSSRLPGRSNLIIRFSLRNSRTGMGKHRPQLLPSCSSRVA